MLPLPSIGKGQELCVIDIRRVLFPVALGLGVGLAMAVALDDVLLGMMLGPAVALAIWSDLATSPVPPPVQAPLPAS